MKTPELLKFLLGLKLRKFRFEKGLSLQGLSKLSGLSSSYLNEIEKGKKYPKVDKLILLAKSLKIRLADYKEFPDHYNYTDNDLQKLKELAKTKGCKLITTEKDYFRIKKTFRKNINFLKIELVIDQEKKFYKYLKERL